jgi:ankyrin repeat protein
MLSSKGRLDQMEGAAYIRLYEKSIEEAKTREKGRNNTWFILSRSKEEPVSLPKKYLFKISVDDIEKSNLTDLRILANNYSILDMIDKQGNSLLHIASFNDNPAITKWLIMRGIDINMLNHKGASALDIAENRQYWRIYNLLEQAGAQQ